MKYYVTKLLQFSNIPTYNNCNAVELYIRIMSFNYRPEELDYALVNSRRGLYMRLVRYLIILNIIIYINIL